MRRIARFLSVLSLMVAMLLSPAPAAASVKPRQLTRSQWLNGYYLYSWNKRTDMLAFCLETGGNTDLWAMPLSGGAMTRLTSDEGQQILPALSPDGTMLAFLSDRGGSWSLWVSGSDGTGARKLLPVVRITPLTTEPLWSPDGKSLVTISFKGGNWDLWNVRPEGRTAVQLTHDDRKELAFSWIDGGRRILYASTDEGQSHICTVNADGSEEARLTGDHGVFLLPSPAPDGSSIAYVEGGAMNSKIGLMNFDGSQRHCLTFDNCLNTLPRFSPDSARIAYLSDREESLNVWSIRKDGRDSKRLTRCTGSLFGLRWLAEDLISFISYHANLFELLTAAVGTGQVNSLVESTAFTGKPCWSPEEDLLYCTCRKGDMAQLVTITLQGRVREIAADAPPGAREYPALSPDGSKLAFSLSTGGCTHIWTSRNDGSGAEPLTDGEAADILPCWSPDASRIACYRRERSRWLLCISSVSSRKLICSTAVSDVDAHAAPPCWSPDGRKILALCREKSVSILRSMDTASGVCSEIARSRSPMVNPLFSHDGSSALYFVRTQGRDELWSHSLESGRSRRIANSSRSETLPFCSSAGDSLVMTRGRAVWHMNACGTGRKEILNTQDGSSFPVLSPSGTKVAFLSSRGNNSDLFLLNLPAPPPARSPHQASGTAGDDTWGEKKKRR